MTRRIHPDLSRRERQIMDVLLAAGEASAEEVRARMPDPPSNSAVRAMLARLEEKGHIRHGERGLRYVYLPTVSREVARRSAVSRLVEVFYGGSLAGAVNGLLELSVDRLDAAELDRLATTIEEARKGREETR